MMYKGQRVINIELYPARHTRLLVSLIEYCNANTGLRFWQAVRNWAGVNFLYFSNIPAHDRQSVPSEELYDTFYYEGKNK